MGDGRDGGGWTTWVLMKGLEGAEGGVGGLGGDATVRYSTPFAEWPRRPGANEEGSTDFFFSFSLFDRLTHNPLVLELLFPAPGLERTSAVAYSCTVG